MVLPKSTKTLNGFQFEGVQLLYFCNYLNFFSRPISEWMNKWLTCACCASRAKIRKNCSEKHKARTGLSYKASTPLRPHRRFQFLRVIRPQVRFMLGGATLGIKRCHQPLCTNNDGCSLKPNRHSVGWSQLCTVSTPIHFGTKTAHVDLCQLWSMSLWVRHI